MTKGKQGRSRRSTSFYSWVQVEFAPNDFNMVVPYWFPVAAMGVLGFTFSNAYFYRFSLRTLFIATTLVAVVLGIILATVR